MVEILLKYQSWMDDIYPKMEDSFLGSRKSNIEKWFNEAYNDYKTLFSTEQEFNQYLKKLPPRYSELLINVSKFYGIIYNVLPKLESFKDLSKLNRIKNLMHLRDSIELIMIFSVIERLQTTKRKYMATNVWLGSDECKSFLKKISLDQLEIKELGKKLQIEYNKTYGSRNAIADFISDHFTSKEQKDLVRSYLKKTQYVEKSMSKIFRNNPNFQSMSIHQVAKLANSTVREAFLPICYNNYCYVDYSQCWPDYECILNNQSKLKEYVFKITKKLVYAYRNRFVHKASIVTFGPSKSKEKDVHLFHYAVFDKINGKLIQHQLKLDFLHDAFKKAFKLFFDNQIKGD